MKVINKHKDNIPPEYVYIGRGSPYGNLYVIGEKYTREQAVALHKCDILKAIIENNVETIEILKRLKRSDTLLCFCKPQICHGDTYVEICEEIHKLGEGDFNKGLRLFIPKALSMLEKDPTLDGYTHINIYSKGKTELGRMLSNWYDAPFVSPKYGYFRNMECFYYYLTRGCKYDSLRTLSGYEANKQGRLYEKVHLDNFENELIHQGLFYKIYQNYPLRQLLEESELPFSHYHTYRENEKTLIHDPVDKSKWLTEGYELLRRQFKVMPFKVIIAGSRSITDQAFINNIMFQLNIKPNMIISGDCPKGVDQLGIYYGRHVIGVPIKPMPANWQPEGKNGPVDRSAGMKRNRQMAHYGDCLVAFWDGESPGTHNMISEMKRLYKQVILVKYPSGDISIELPLTK